MPTKAQIKRLLEEKDLKLTGKQAARLILKDSLEIESKQKGFLSADDIERIKNAIESKEEAQIYNSWLLAYQAIDFSIKEAQIMFLDLDRVVWREVYAFQQALIKNLDNYDSNCLDNLVTIKPKNTSLKTTKEQISNVIKKVLSCSQVMEIVSKDVGVDFTAKLKTIYKELEQTIDRYNQALCSAKTPLKVNSPNNLQPLNLTTFEADPDTVEYIAGRIELGLGKGWWQEVTNQEVSPIETSMAVA